jgi:hypothetical protein
MTELPPVAPAPGCLDAGERPSGLPRALREESVLSAVPTRRSEAVAAGHREHGHRI